MYMLLWFMAMSWKPLLPLNRKCISVVLVRIDLINVRSHLLVDPSPHFYYQFVYFLPSGSPSVAIPVYDKPSRTLTCTSTGGPATAVTWRRDGELITLNATYQQTKRVVDPVVGTYHTLLTIDPSVDIMGGYNCTVENARGSGSATLIIAGNGELTPYMHCLLGLRINYHCWLIIDI